MIRKTGLMILFNMFLSLSWGQSSEDLFCFYTDFEVENIAGYNVSDKQKKRLASSYVSEDSHRRGKTDIVNSIVARIQKARKEGYDLSKNPISDDRLAEEIYDAAIAFGHDPKIFAAMIEVESSFRVGVIGKNGSGLTQMTSVALQEMTYQYEKEDVGAIYAQLAKNYFGSESAVQSWMKWAQQRASGDPAPRQSKKASKYNFKRKELPINYRFALAAGASSLKLKLARHNGHYGKALTDYNSVFSSYDNRVMARSQKVSLDCSHSEKIENIQKISCELSASNRECFQTSEKLMNKKISVEI